MEEKYISTNKKKISELTKEEKNKRDIYLKGLADGIIAGPFTGHPDLDKVWLQYFSDDAILEGFPEEKIYDYLYNCNKDYLDGVALVFRNVKITYRELFAKIDEYAKAYQNMGVKKGDIVTICMPSLPETIYSFYALNRIGAVSDMIDPRASVEQMKFYLEQSKSKYMFLYEDCLIKAHKAYKGTNLEKVIISGPTTSLGKVSQFLYNKFKKKTYITEDEVKNDDVEYIKVEDFVEKGKKEKEVIESKYEPNEFALLVHSSGTTSMPKGIALSNDNVNALSFSYKISELDLKRKDKFLSVIPAFAAFGMVASVQLPLSLGMETILIPAPKAEEFADYFNKYKPQHCLTVPKNYEAMAKSGKIKDLSYFKSAGCGGDAPDQEGMVNKFLKDKGCPNPLLKGWGLSEDIATYNDKVPNEVIEDVADIQNASQTLLEIVGNILDINKIEADKMEIVEGPYNFKEEISNLCRIGVTRIGEKNINFKLSLSQAIPYELIGDKAKVKTVVQNFMTNAIKYTDEGEVNLTVKCLNDTNKNISNLIIECQDTGRGIKPEMLGRVFEKFDRLDVEKNSTVEGTGLGLVITKSIVEMMGGKIEVKSQEGVGSTFTATIPQKIGILRAPEAENKNYTQEVKNGEVTETIGQKKILIVDDNALNIKVAERALKDFNFIIDEAHDGLECLDKVFATNDYDLILMDIMMPNMNGEEALAKLKEKSEFHTPVIALTADAVAGAKEKYLAEGFTEYISKPFSRDQIKEKLDKIFN